MFTTETAPGRWAVVDHHGEILVTFDSNADAWSWIDAHSPDEQRADRQRSRFARCWRDPPGGWKMLDH
jgi:hypothetical protein